MFMKFPDENFEVPKVIWFQNGSFCIKIWIQIAKIWVMLNTNLAAHNAHQLKTCSLVHQQSQKLETEPSKLPHLSYGTWSPAVYVWLALWLVLKAHLKRFSLKVFFRSYLTLNSYIF